MSRLRFIDPCIWKSEQFNALPDDHTRLLWIGILTTADDEGRRKATPESLKADIFPLKKVRLTTLGAERNALAAAGLIRVYPDGEGKPILDIPKWDKYQTEKYRKPSAFSPAPSGDALEKVSESSAKVEKVSSYMLPNTTLQPSSARKPTPKGSGLTPEAIRLWWNAIADGTGLPKTRKLTTRRKQKIASRLKDESWQNLDALEAAIRSNDWFCRRDDRKPGSPHEQWIGNLDWLIRSEDSAVKLLEDADAPKRARKPAEESQTARNERIFAGQDAQAAKDAQDKKGGR